MHRYCMTIIKGQIHHIQAYAQGKMLDHKDWNLPRNIKPSDIDMFIDNNGQLLFIELSSSKTAWQQIQDAQRKAYAAIVAMGRGGCMAVLATHNVPTDRQINTVKDINSFHLMMWTEDGVEYPIAPIHSNEAWIELITNFTKYMSVSEAQNLRDNYNKA